MLCAMRIYREIGTPAGLHFEDRGLPLGETEMSHLLPPTGSELRDAFDVRDLVAIATKERQAPTLREAWNESLRTFDGTPRGTIKRIYSIVLEADDKLALWSFGSRGGKKREWVFGQGLTGNGGQ